MAEKKKILLLSMGGTIFSVIENGTVRVAENVSELVRLVPRIQEVADVSFETVVNLDSTNVGIEEWLLLLGRIAERYQDYDAFVVAHGTNTMAYTATVLSFGLGSTLTKPVILTGSQLPLTAYGDDARFNLEHSVHTAVMAVENRIAEVMICFNDLVLRGCRTVKVSESDFRAFDSPALDPVARINANGIGFAGHAKKVGSIPFCFNQNVQFSREVLSIDLVPGLSPDTLDQLVKIGGIRGIIIKSHGAGSVPDQGEMSLIPFIERSAKNGISIVVTSKFLGGNSFRQTNDEPAVRALEAGAITSRDMTDVAAQVKLMYMIARGDDYKKIAKNFGNSMVGEVNS
ncbi:MAG TPA: asparaginase domain-containing protein [bacterium]|nr:asparaginase domain-containing protein [bacterium]